MLRTCPVPLQAARPPADHLVAHCGAPSVAVAGKLGLNVPRNTSPASASSLPDSTDDLVDVDAELVTSSPSLDGNASESMIGRSENGNSLNITPPMLVSAMKGSRAKRGIVTNLSVSWAPDVYDPPVTSDSHTVRPHHRSSRKSHYKYKPPKGGSSSSSSSRSSSGSKKDKKHSHHSSRAGDHSLV